MFDRLFKKKPPQPSGQVLVAQLNAKLQPMQRGGIFEDPLDAVLKKANRGEVSGGGTLVAESGEIQCCDIEIQVPDSSSGTIDLIIETLENRGAPKGSKLIIEATGHEVPFGVREGIAVYLNGTDLPQKTYEECDSNYVVEEFIRLLEGEGRVAGFWQGPTETALYAYGGSFDVMKERLSEFVRTYPLCERCRVVQIA